MVTSCDGMLGVASDVGGVGVGLEGPGLGPGNGRAASEWRECKVDACVYSILVIDACVHVCVSRMCVCMLLKDHALTEDDVNQWWRNDPWSELAAVCCPGCFRHFSLKFTVGMIST